MCEQSQTYVEEIRAAATVVLPGRASKKRNPKHLFRWTKKPSKDLNAEKIGPPQTCSTLFRKHNDLFILTLFLACGEKHKNTQVSAAATANAALPPKQ